MQRLSSFLVAASFSVGGVLAQTSDIVVFSEMGEKFTLVIDGDVKNEAPATRVVATGIKNATPRLVVRFEDAAIAPLTQNAWMEPGQEYTIRIATNKKGERVFRMQGQAPLGTAAATPDKPRPGTFVDDDASAAPSEPAPGSSGTTTTTTVEETSGDGGNVNMNVGINGMNMTMGFTDGSGATTRTTATTTVTHTSSYTGSQVQATEEPSAPAAPAYRMPGYSGPIGCPYPMSDGEFDSAKNSISSKGFEDTKMTLAKQIGRDRCFTTAQVKTIMQLFGFEDSKLDFAKFAYDHTYDIGNYHQVNDVFGFESSVDELDQYIRSR